MSLINKLNVIEPRNEDGSLNVNSTHWRNGYLTAFWNNATDNQIFDYYFKQNRLESSVSSEDCVKWYNAQGLFIRVKNW